LAAPRHSATGGFEQGGGAGDPGVVDVGELGAKLLSRLSSGAFGFGHLLLGLAGVARCGRECLKSEDGLERIVQLAANGRGLVLGHLAAGWPR
jgi:hypothetical protein